MEITVPRMVVLLGVLVPWGWIAEAQVRDAVDTAKPPAELHGSGDWAAADRAARATQRWSLDVARSPDGSLRGRISVADSPLLRDGNVEGQLKGNVLTGIIVDDEGKFLAKFFGTVSGAGVRGQYTDASGELGHWEWDGPLPQ